VTPTPATEPVPPLRRRRTSMSTRTTRSSSIATSTNHPAIPTRTRRKAEGR
jgi:hypothetical protein